MRIFWTATFFVLFLGLGSSIVTWQTWTYELPSVNIRIRHDSADCGCNEGVQVIRSGAPEDAIPWTVVNDGDSVWLHILAGQRFGGSRFKLFFAVPFGDELPPISLKLKCQNLETELLDIKDLLTSIGTDLSSDITVRMSFKKLR